MDTARASETARVTVTPELVDEQADAHVRSRMERYGGGPVEVHCSGCGRVLAVSEDPISGGRCSRCIGRIKYTGRFAEMTRHQRRRALGISRSRAGR